jgi:predicted transcriptional regulator
MFTHRSGALLFTVIFLLFISISTAYPVDYQVESGYSYENPHPPDTVIKLSWWELSIRDIIIFSLAAYAPILIFPLELFFFLKVFTYLGYRKINEKIVLDNKMRLTIYSNIQNNPGVTAPEIADNLELNLGTVRYHLAMLELMRKVTLLSNPGFTAYFENHDIHSEMEKKVLYYLKNETKVKIFHFLRESPEISRQGIANRLEISGPAVTWHMHQLVNDHLIIEKQEGRFVRYSLDPQGIPLLEKYLSKRG